MSLVGGSSIKIAHSRAIVRNLNFNRSKKKKNSHSVPRATRPTQWSSFWNRPARPSSSQMPGHRRVLSSTLLTDSCGANWSEWCTEVKRISTIEELKERLTACWDQLSQRLLARAVGAVRKRLLACVTAHGAGFEHMLRWTAEARMRVSVLLCASAKTFM